MPMQNPSHIIDTIGLVTVRVKIQAQEEFLTAKNKQHHRLLWPALWTLVDQDIFRWVWA
jgi:hypothetical protein